MKKRENKNNHLTVRLTEEESNSLDYLAINHDRTKSDVIMRACRLYLNMDRPCMDENDNEKNTKKPIRVHVRMPDADMDNIREHESRTGESISQVIRRAVRAFYEVSRNSY